MNLEKTVLYIDSSHRTSGTSENFTIKLLNPIQKVLWVEIIGAEVPYTFYVINANNNKLSWGTANNQYITTIIPGNYSMSTFCKTLQSSMNKVVDGFVISYVSEQYRVTFNNLTPFFLDHSLTTMSRLIGLTETSGLSSWYIPKGIINMCGPRYLMIKSSKLTQPKITRSFINAGQDSVLYKIVVSGRPGEILTEKNMYTNLLKYGVRQTVQEMDFQLVNDRNEICDLNGSDWSFTLNLVTD